MTCAEVFRRLDDFLDRELGPEELRRVQEHLDICLECAREARFESALLDGLRQRLRRIQLPSDLALRVHAELARAQKDDR
jgi:anti-sigma factor (TIGR02949 family)